MAQKLPNTPTLPQVVTSRDIPAGVAFLYSSLIRTLVGTLAEYARRINAALMADGSESMTGPIKLKEVAVADLGDYPAAVWEGSEIYVPDEAGGATLAYSDGTNWRRVQDNAVVS